MMTATCLVSGDSQQQEMSNLFLKDLISHKSDLDSSLHSFRYRLLQWQYSGFCSMLAQNWNVSTLLKILLARLKRHLSGTSVTSIGCDILALYCFTKRSTVPDPFLHLGEHMHYMHCGLFRVFVQTRPGMTDLLTWQLWKCEVPFNAAKHF